MAQELAHSADPVTLAIIGCGQRGEAYTRYALQEPTACKVVAIAEPRPSARANFATAHSVDPTLVFKTWQELLDASAETIKLLGRRLADAVLVTVQDQMHLEVVLAFAAQGYHILCEKPMGTTVEDCLKMEAAVKKAGVIFGMGHVLRYSPYSQAITEIIRSGALGQLINVVHIEPVGFWHFAHSYVRGSWAKEKESCFSLMTKSCHDIDILCHWLSPAVPLRVSSFGSLQQYRKASKPPAAGAARRCFECLIERECPFSAKRIYLDPVSEGNTAWPAAAIVDGIPDIENITEALRSGPYGQCVYESDNDVCDNQVVNMEFSNGASVSFTMVAQTTLICERQTRLHFAYGEIVGDMNTFTLTDFRTRKTTKHHPESHGGGHGGGDLGLIRSFVEAVRTKRQELVGTNVDEVTKSHLTVFAAEKSRREGKVIDCAAFEVEARRVTAPEPHGMPPPLPSTSLSPPPPDPTAPAQPTIIFLPLLNQTANQRRMLVEYPAQFAGLAHAGTWTVKCVVNGVEQGAGSGVSKQLAKEEAAKQACFAMGWVPINYS